MKKKSYTVRKEDYVQYVGMLANIAFSSRYYESTGQNFNK